MIEKINTLFGGKYRVLDILGHGGMGAVYLAENTTLGTKWAIKTISKAADSDFDLLAEPNILKKINHPALPRIVDIAEDSEFLYIIEDYIEGESLDKQLTHIKKFDEATVLEWAKQLCNIFHYLHNLKPNPIIYRDLKPGNIIISSDNTVKLIDFGIAREYKAGSGSDTTYMGTRGYAAPEQYGTGQTDARTDIYSLGVTMYHLLTGKSPNEPPYEFKQLRRIDSSLSEGIEYIVNKCVQNNPDNRYSNIVELFSDLENIYTFNSYYKKKKRGQRIKLLSEGIALVACVTLCTVSALNISKERVDYYSSLIEEGYNCIDQYNIKQAEEYFDEAVKTDKKNPEAYMGKAQIFLKQGRTEDCLAYLNSVAESIPESQSLPQFNYLLGSVMYNSLDYEQALLYIGKAYEAEPYNEDYARDVAVCYAKCGNLEKAGEILKTIPEDGENDDILNFIKGQVYWAEDNTSKAIKCFKEVISITKDEDLKTRAYIELSNIYKERRHIDKDALKNQIAILKEAVTVLEDEDNFIITEALAEACFTAQEYDIAIIKFSRLLELGYERPYIYRNIAIIYQQTGDFDNAMSTLEIMREKYPDNYQCYMQFAYLYIEIETKKPEYERDYSEALECYELAVQFAPSGKNTSDMIQLTALIEELRDGGWID